MFKEITWEDDDGNEVVTNVPARWEVCSECDGNGSHLCDSLRGQAFTPEEMYEDEDFAEGYFGGRYDVKCNVCMGRTTTLEINYDAQMTDEQKAAIKYEEERNQANYEDECTMRAERAMGA